MREETAGRRRKLTEMLDRLMQVMIRNNTYYRAKEKRMAEYHVGCGIAGIYAGTVKKNGEEWKSKSEVTDEAICAVRDWFMMNKPKDKEQFGYVWDKKDGGHVTLLVMESADSAETEDNV